MNALTTNYLGVALLNGPRIPMKHTLLGVPGFMIWNFLIILLVALIFYWLLRGARKAQETPLELLKKRYVKGEIDKKKFEEMRKVIGD